MKDRLAASIGSFFAHVCGLRFVRVRHQSLPSLSRGLLEADVGCSLVKSVQSGFPTVEFCCINWLLFLYDHTEAAVPLFELVVRRLSRQCCYLICLGGSFTLNSLEGPKLISTIAGVTVSPVQCRISGSKWRNQFQCVWGPQGSLWIP